VRCPRRSPDLLRLLTVLALATGGCAGASPDLLRAEAGKMLDGWHRAAARADEEAYFGQFHPTGVFLGTDQTERWDVAAFRAYAHPYFKKGKAWTFRAARRAVALSEDGKTAWFDEDLATQNLGPARGSGVLIRQSGPGAPRWQIAQYNLSIPIPNARFDEVKRLIASPPPPPPQK
jgi:hypothetical protein